MSVPPRNERRLGLIWLECKGTSHEAKVGTRLRHRCLDGCYGNRRHSEALCVVILAEASGKGKGVKRGKREDEGLIEWLKLRLRSHTLTSVNQRWIPKYFRSAVGVLEGIPERDWRNSFPGSGVEGAKISLSV